MEENNDNKKFAEAKLILYHKLLVQKEAREMAKTGTSKVKANKILSEIQYDSKVENSEWMNKTKSRKKVQIKMKK